MPSELSSTLFYGYFVAERVGEIGCLVMVTGTVFITSSENDVRAAYLNCFCKVHQSACCALKNQAIGGAQSGKNTKVHVLMRIQLLNVILTSENIHDSEPALDLFAGFDLNGKKVLADKAYSCQAIRDYLEKQGTFICIPDKSTFKTKHTFDTELYKQRNLVERFFQHIKNYRHIVTHFDKYYT